MTDSLVTERLILRPWRAGDGEPIAAMNRDPEVTRLLNRPTDETVVAGFFDAMTQHWHTHGYGPWIIELRNPGARGAVVGFAGLAHLPPFLAAAGPGPELGWRLARSAWGHGYATEAAQAALADAFGRLQLTDVVSVIHPDNVRSQRVAAKLGMHLGRQIDNPMTGRGAEVWQLGAAEAS